MYVLHHILDAMNFYKKPFLVNFFPVNFEFTVKGFNCITLKMNDLQCRVTRLGVGYMRQKN